MTKVKCGKLDCIHLGANYECILNELRMARRFGNDGKMGFSCGGYEADKRWDSFVKALQEKIDKGEDVI